MRFYFAAFLLTLALVAPGFAADGVLSYAGATTLQTSFMPEAAQVFSNETGGTFKILGGNTDAGLLALRQKLVNLAGAGRHLRPEEKAAGLKETLIGWDAMLVLVHRSNPVTDLTLDQLHGIFAGDIANWKEVGGTDAPILVVTSPRGSAMRAAAQDLLRLKTYTSNEITVALVSDADRQMTVLPLAITILSASMADVPDAKSIAVGGISATPETVADHTYPLVKPLLLVTRGEPTGTPARFLRFALSEKGQTIMARKFYRLR